MEIEKIAGSLLAPIWRGIDPEYKRRYSYSIWQQFENQIRSAAYTSNLSRFYDQFCRRMAVAILSKDQSSLGEAISSGEDRQILKALREETATLVLLVRLENDQKKENHGNLRL